MHDKVTSAADSLALTGPSRAAALRFAPYVHDDFNAAVCRVRSTYRTAAHDTIVTLRHDQPALTAALNTLHTSFREAEAAALA